MLVSRILHFIDMDVKRNLNFKFRLEFRLVLGKLKETTVNILSVAINRQNSIRTKNTE
jgi:hypothetical protein